MSNLKINQLITLSLLGFGLTACGGGGGSKGPNVYSGVFKDSAVQGLSYTSGGQKGITGKNGDFKFEEDGTVTFSVGGATIGSAKAKNVMTPMSLVSGGTANTVEVINRVRFLMMLDKDSDPTNGIEITKAVQDIAKKNWGSVDFGTKFPDSKTNRMAADASAKDGDAHYIPSAEEAKTHFNKTLKDITAAEQCVDSGAFVGTYTGSEKGNISLMIDPTTNGAVIGSIFSADAPVVVTSKTAIDYKKTKRSFVSQTNKIKFTGTLDSGNILKGTWVNIDDATKKGSFEAKRLGGDSGSSYRYTAVFEGKSTPNRGIVALDVYSNNSLKGKYYDVMTNKTETVTGKINGSNELENTTLSNKDKMKGDIVSSSIEAYVVGKTEIFTANRCKLSK